MPPAPQNGLKWPDRARKGPEGPKVPRALCSPYEPFKGCNSRSTTYGGDILVVERPWESSMLMAMPLIMKIKAVLLLPPKPVVTAQHNISPP